MDQQPIQQVEMVRPESGAFLQAEVEKAVREILDNRDVIEARAAWEAAQNRIPELSTAHRNLNRQCVSYSEEFVQLRDQLRDRLIELAGQSGDPEELGSLVVRVEGLRARHRAALEAVEYIVEHAAPRSQIAEILAHSQFLDVLASKLKRRADERLAGAMAQLAGVAETEGILAFDPSRGVAGSLDRLANDYSIEAAGLRNQAHVLDRKYSEFCGQQALTQKG